MRDQNILKKIVDAAKLTKKDTVLEVGPGEGLLTALLLERAGSVVAVEKDDRLIPALTEKFKEEIAAQKLELIHGDILTLDTKRYTLNAKRYSIVANLPYYITGQFLRKFLSAEYQPSSMTLLLQKEVVNRIMARDKKESILSISVKCYGTPRSIGTVKAGAFSPPPKVDSAILAIEEISKRFFEDEGKAKPFLARFRLSEAEFFQTLKRGFAHPRKLLASNLGLSASARIILAECGVAPKARAEEITLAQWRAITSLTHERP